MVIKSNLPHIFVQSKKSETTAFQAVKGFPTGKSRLTAKQQRYLHAQKLINEFDDALNSRLEKIQSLSIDGQELTKGVCLEIEGPLDRLDFEKLENRGSKKHPIELLNVRIEDDNIKATIFIPIERLKFFKNKIEKYGDESRDIAGNKASTLFIDSIDAIRLADLDAFWIGTESLSNDIHQEHTWEVWLRKNVIDLLRSQNIISDCKVSKHSLNFHECEICLITTSLSKLAVLQISFAPLLAFRLQEQPPSFFANFLPYQQTEWVESLEQLLQPADFSAPAVCVLDTGVMNSHKLLSQSISDQDCDSYDPQWGVQDISGHGTSVSGLALFGDLTPLLATSSPVVLSHRLESVKILPNSGKNPEELYGWITKESVNRAIVNAPTRKRVFCLAITSEHVVGEFSNGKPTPWSAEIDKLSMGVADSFDINDQEKKLFVISVGNIRDLKPNEYFSRNDLESIENPSQSWNALAVGAITHKVFSEDKKLDGWDLVANVGDLSPTSRTSYSWINKEWPIKPDIVLEGGNRVSDGSIVSDDTDLSLLTTGIKTQLISFDETSAAAAQAARMAAILHSEYPDYWPETVKGLLVHSASWTKAMYRGIQKSKMKTIDKENMLRRFGYGVPDFDIAKYSATNRACLILQDEIQPFFSNRNGEDVKDGFQMNIHNLPWPAEFLTENGFSKLSMKITLSYFIEPNPSEIIPSRKHSYASHSLRFDLKRVSEDMNQFRQRINKKDRPKLPQGEEFSRPRTHEKWMLGPNTRNKGTVVTDQWNGTAADFAEQSAIVITPESGWWKYRKHLNRTNQKVRYSLIVTLQSTEEIDIYSHVLTQIPVESEIVISDANSS